MTRAVGLAGLVGVMPDDPQGRALFAARELRVGGRLFPVLGAQPRGRGAVVELAGVKTRAEAEALRGLVVEVERAVLPALEKDAYYAADLVGLWLWDRASGAKVGKIRSVAASGGVDLLVVEREGRPDALVPFARAYGPEVGEGEVRMTLPEGLLEL